MAKYKLSKDGSEFKRIIYDGTEYDVVKLNTGEYIFSKNELELNYPTKITIPSNNIENINIEYEKIVSWIQNKDKLLISDIPSSFGSNYDFINTAIVTSGNYSFSKVLDDSGFNTSQSLLPINQKRKIPIHLFLKQSNIKNITCSEYVIPHASSPYVYNWGDQKKLYLFGLGSQTGYQSFSLGNYYQEESGGSDKYESISFKINFLGTVPTMSSIRIAIYIESFGTDSTDKSFYLTYNNTPFNQTLKMEEKKYYNGSFISTPGKEIEVTIRAHYKVNQNASVTFKVLPILVG